jgi:hypothetical protein
MATLVSPGVSVTVLDESNYASSGPGTIPFILLATTSNKSGSAGGIAANTTTATAGIPKLMSSQKDLLNTFGTPIFQTDASGNRLYGSETAEYGLMAAHSVLGISNQAWVLRADVDLAQLTGSINRPYGNPVSGTQWLNTASTSWGIFEWDAVNQQFVAITPYVITDTTNLSASVPSSSFGSVGQYAVVSYYSNNPIYVKAYDNTWNLLGSTGTISPNAWQSKTPTLVGTITPTTLTVGNTIGINGTTITLSGTTASSLVTQINTAAIPGVTAAVLPTGYFALFVTSSSKSNGSVVDGKIALSNAGVGTPLSNLGLTSGTFYGVSLQYGAHYSVPTWKSTDATPAQSGSVWIKTTNVNGGVNTLVYRWNGTTSHWDLIPALEYQHRRVAIYAFDPVTGGLGIGTNTLFMKYDISANNTATSKLLQWQGSGLPMTVTGSVTAPTFTAGNQFTIQTTVPGSSSLSALYTVTLSGTSAASFVQNVQSLSIPYLTCTVSSSGYIQFSHLTAGDIVLAPVSGQGTPLTAAGFSTSLPNVYDDTQTGTLNASYWQPAVLLVQQSTAPVVDPTDGTLWYYSSPLEVDIMINNGTIWKGYKNVSSDSRGFPLNTTDPLGPMISASVPTVHTDGTALVKGDIWLDSSDLEHYPSLYRWQSVGSNNILQWVAIDNTDNTSENGIIFGDARWDTNGTVDPALGTKPTIVSLQMSDYVDLDSPNPQLYPRGMLLFNTRRSSYNVKSFLSTAFTGSNYPIATLPAQPATWVSYSGKDANNVPYFGRKAQRNVVVSALSHAVDNSTILREDQVNFNILVCPGYPELTDNLVTLNNDRRNTGFVIADSPMGLSSDLTSVNNYITNTSGTATDGEAGLVTADSYTAVFYPGAAFTNSLDGVGQVVVPMTHAILRMIVKSDQSSAPWFAPAGALRGKIDNVAKIGYVDRVTGKFVSIGTNQGLRDLLYSNNVNPVAVFPNDGIINYGNHTRQGTATALDRINVARLINYIRSKLERIVKPLIFQPNDTVTRNQATQLVSGMLNNIMAQRGLYDYLVVCDTTNNTPTTIDQNELHIDIAIEPTKAVEFIYVPVRILNTGAISGSNNNQGGISNTASSVKLTA